MINIELVVRCRWMQAEKQEKQEKQEEHEEHEEEERKEEDRYRVKVSIAKRAKIRKASVVNNMREAVLKSKAVLTHELADE